jgi:tetratricopeptide (TPR) repeat protein
MSVNPAMQTGDQQKVGYAGIQQMRILIWLWAFWLGMTLLLTHPQTAAAAEGEQSWQTCIGATAKPDDRVSACSAVIDAKTETGRKLAVAHCNRGEGLTEKRQLDSALADLNEAVRIDPAYPCAYANRGRVYAFKGDPDRAIADVYSWNNRGQAKMRLGDKSGAIADFKKALQLQPGLDSARDSLRDLGVKS